MMKLFIGNLSYETEEVDLREKIEELEEVGPILNFHRPSDFTTGKPRGFAFVTFETREEGETVMDALDGMKLDGRELRVNEAEERQRTHPADRPRQVSMKVDVKPVDDRPVDSKGNKIRYKAI